MNGFSPGGVVRRLEMKIFAMLFSATLVVSFSLSLALGEGKAKEEKPFTASMDKDGVQRVELVGGDYFFNPSHIIVKVKVPVELKVKKEGGIVPHDLVMKSPEAGMEFKLTLHEEPQIIRFTPTKTGSYPFYCDKKLLFFESHREKGMEGTLEVVE